MIIKNKITNLEKMFYKYNKLKNIDKLKYLKLNIVIILENMFLECSSLKDIKALENGMCQIIIILSVCSVNVHL